MYQRQKNNVRIDIFGWSRGAVMAIKLAQDLKRYGLTVRFLGLVDPCDTGNDMLTDVTIPSNVQVAVREIRDGNYDWKDSCLFDPISYKRIEVTPGWFWNTVTEVPIPVAANGVNLTTRKWSVSHVDIGLNSPAVENDLYQRGKRAGVPFR
jgi:hypothetical protein